MTRSMTAFARAETQLDGMSLCWEIKSVNHRYLDISFRLPEAWRFLETALRAACRGQIFRGKVECQLKISEQLLTDQALSINEELVVLLLKKSEKLARDNHLQNDMTLSSLLSWPGIVTSVQPDVEQFANPVLNLFKGTLQQLQIARTNEGQALKEAIQNRLGCLQEEILRVKKRMTNYVHIARDKILERLHAIQLDVEKVRVEQEIAIILTKMDVNEELDRLQIHTQEVSKVLESSDSTGRRLDFLMQELNREANTLGSKSDCIELTQSAVEMKVLIEQMREQIQNIE